MSTSKQKALDLLKNNLDSRLITYLNSCVHCGLCAESCHYYLSNNKYLPVQKVELLSQIYSRYNTILGRIIPKFINAKNFDDVTINKMIDIFFGSCTMCGRCSINCSIGIDIPLLVRTARSMLFELGLVPAGLQSTVEATVNTGNNMAIPREEFVDTLEWLEEDLRLEVNDETASIPMDKVGKNILYTLNPREPKFFPLSISAIAKIFYAAKEIWTISTNCYDVTNYPYFSGDNNNARELTQRLYNEMIKLKANRLILAECGHGSRAIRWEGPRWIENSYPFEVITVIELIAEYLRSGRIKLDPTKNTDVVTLHDPCNLVRSGGIIEEQRFILKNAVSNFVEMIPNRIDNYCCGGGGGQLSMGEYNSRRIESGVIKANQIRKTGATVVATPCHNCIDQLSEINNEYKLGVKVKTISEIVADALVIIDIE